jgi:5-carboxymethyl-2-hydroxymuconate isomerase
LKYLDATLAIYKSRQMKHLKHTPKTLAKTLEKHMKTIANIRSIHLKYLQHTSEK